MRMIPNKTMVRFPTAKVIEIWSSDIRIFFGDCFTAGEIQASY